MKANRINPNQTEIIGAQVSVLFSYATPVAAHVAGVGYFRTSVRHSVTTSRHVNTWLRDNGASMDKVREMRQEFFDAIDFDADAIMLRECGVPTIDLREVTP